MAGDRRTQLVDDLVERLDESREKMTGIRANAAVETLPALAARSLR
ncbi:hypothetical protein [Microbacterium aurum]